VVYLSLVKNELDPSRNAHVHFIKPRSRSNAHVFRVLIHISAVEDLLFYHHPREDLIQDGKVLWRDFHWQYGKADGELVEEDIHPPTAVYGLDWLHPRRHPRDDDEDHDYNQRRSRTRGFLSYMSGCIDGRGRSNERLSLRGRGSGWYRGESSQGRTRAASPPP
jgi:hypothetical protein